MMMLEMPIMYSLFNRRGAEVWFRDDWQKVVE